MCCTGYEMARYKGTQASHLYEKSMHTLCTIQWATAPGRSLNYPRPKSITHLCTFSDNGVYVTFAAILSNSGFWPVTPGINTLLLSTGILGSFTCSGMTLDIHGTNSFTWYPSHGRHSPMLNLIFLLRVFTPYKFGSTAGDQTPDLLTTRPTCYHSATALC